MRYALRILLLSFGIMMACCKQQKQKVSDPTPVKSDTATTVQIIDRDSLLKETGREILYSLSKKDYAAFSRHFDSTTKVRFSPYGYIDTASDRRLSQHEFDSLIAGNKAVLWGSYDGSGDPINLTAKQYIDKFVYNADFLKAEKIAVDSFIGTGNSLNNLKKIYPGARFIEYHFSGFDKKYGGMDWTSLRLLFKESGHSYKLIAIVHDQWTI